MRRFLLNLLAVIFVFSATAQELNVASINIRLNSKKDYKRQNGWDDRKSYLFDMINFEGFDIFGAQEVKKRQLDDMLNALPDYGYVGVGRDDGAKKGEFSPVFYRKDKFKLLDSGTFWLSETPDEVSKGWDAVCRRVCSWGYFQRKSDKKRFYFFSTHLDHRGKVAQVEGAKVILNFIKKNCKGKPVVLVGDFNVTQNSDCYRLFAKSGSLKDSYELAKYRFAPTGTFNGFNPNRCTNSRIDHIFVSKGSRVSRYGVLTYHYFGESLSGEQPMDTAAPKEIKGELRKVKCISDHYPVQAFVTLK